MPPAAKKPAKKIGKVIDVTKGVKPVAYTKFKLTGVFQDRFKDEFRDLLGLPATLRSEASRAHDGRLVKLALVTVHDRTGRSRAGIPLQLLDADGTVVDRAFSSRTGLAILTFPRGAHVHHADGEAEPAPLTGTVRILDGTVDGLTHDVEIPPHSQFADLTIELAELPALPEVPADAESPGGLPGGLWPPQGLGDDPFTNLPEDFTPQLCDAIAAKAGDEGDSLLGKLGNVDDFRARRTPLIKRLSVVRNGELTIPNTKEPRRYVVRLRQSWVFLGYTLGELAEVEALDPGAVLDESVGTVERTVEDVSRLVDQARSFATSTLSDVLNQTNKIDTLVRAATSTEVSAAVGGFGFGIPGLFGVGGIAAVANVSTSASTSTSIDTSLNVNHAISTAQTTVNEAVHTATRTLSSLARTVSTQLGRVSPLLSRVTNLLRWRVYENYVVCTHVEDVLELVSEKVLELDDDQTAPDGVVTTPVFTPVEIVEYRRFFEPTLLEPRLRAEYPGLVDAVRNAGSKPITHVTVEAEYSATLATGRLVVDINGAAAELRLRPENGRAVGVVRFPQPVPASEFTVAELRLSANLHLPNNLTAELIDHLFGVDVTSITLWAGVEPGMRPTHTQPVAMHVDGDNKVADLNLFFTVTPQVIDPTDNPLWVHVNQNPSYYLGVLAQAALLFPSLRDDSDKLGTIPEYVWRLPIVGFEGNRIIVAKDPEPGNSDVKRLLSDPGAATLVQIAAPGAYSEALQGLLSLVDAEGLIHPGLIPAPPATVPPLQIVDLTGKQLVPAPSNNGSSPSPGPVPVP